MNLKSTGRRDFLKQTGLMGSIAMMAGLPNGAMALGGEQGRVIEDAVLPAQSDEAPKYHIKFAVCGMSHDHIYGMIGAVQRGGGEMVAAWGGEDGQACRFHQAISRREDREDAGGDSRRSLDPTCAELADCQ